MENKIFGKNISVDCVFYGFDPEIGLHFYFHYKPFSGLRCAKREREKEERVTDPSKTDRNPAPVPPAPQHWRHHISRTTTEIASPSKIDPPKSITPRLIHRRSHHPRLITPTEIASPSKTDSPKTDLIGATVTHDRSHRPLVVTHDRSRRSLDLVSISSLPMTELVSISLPMTHDQSLPFPPFLITLSSSLSQFD